VGQRLRRLRRARHFRVGTVLAVVVAVLVGPFTLLSTSLGVASAGTPAASPRGKRPGVAALQAHTIKKTLPTKRPRSPYPDPPPNSGAGRRIVYCNSCQRVWLVENDDYVTLSYAVSGRRGVPKPGTYKVRRKVNPGYAKELRLPFFVGFAFGSTTDIGFHGIPLSPAGRPIQSDGQLGRPLSHGCVRENQTNARQLWDWAPMGTPVVVLP